MADLCTKCGNEVRGDSEVYERTLPDGTFGIVIDSTPDRNFNLCDACNATVRFKCSTWPDSGYCDDCFKEYHVGGPILR